jgi:glutaredoxin
MYIKGTKMVNSSNLRSWRLKQASKTSVKPTKTKSVYKRTQIKSLLKKKKKKKTTKKSQKKRSVDGQGTYKIVKKSKTQQPKKWTIYYKDGCKFCAMAKDYLNKKNITFDYIKYDSLENQKKQELTNKINTVKSGFSTFPRIFSPTEFIGGYSDLEKVTDLKN